VPGSAFSAVRREQIRSRSVLFWSIPSPTSRFLVDSGPLHIRWYGLLLALGVLWGAAVARRELRRRSIDPDLTYAIALWVVPLGLIGARLYHVATDWSTLFAGHWERIPKVWEGGLGIYGALIGGMIGGAIAARRYGIALPVLLDCIAPGTALAQALGRFGNYFNQELFGGPTSLPWGLEISLPNRPPAYIQYSTFQPTFLYESLWCLLVAGIVLEVSRRAWRRLPGGALLCLYLSLYSAGRFFVEGLRIDPAHELGPLRLNQVVAAVVFVVAGAAFVLLARRGGPPRLAADASGGRG
jgi:phosphatidylglycerol---prolipoprotein diacylglyceryl transferase